MLALLVCSSAALAEEWIVRSSGGGAGSLPDVLSQVESGDVIRFRVREVRLADDLELPLGVRDLTIRGPVRIRGGTTLIVRAERTTLRRITLDRVDVRVERPGDGATIVGNRFYGADLHLDDVSNTVIGTQGRPNRFNVGPRATTSGGKFFFDHDRDTTLEGNHIAGRNFNVSLAGSSGLVIRRNRIEGGIISGNVHSVVIEENRFVPARGGGAIGIHQNVSSPPGVAVVVRGNRIRMVEAGHAISVDASALTVVANRVVGRPSKRRHSRGIEAGLRSRGDNPEPGAGTVRDNRVRNAQWGLLVFHSHELGGVLDVSQNRVSACNGNAMIVDGGDTGTILARGNTVTGVRGRDGEAGLIAVTDGTRLVLAQNHIVGSLRHGVFVREGAGTVVLDTNRITRCGGDGIHFAAGSRSERRGNTFSRVRGDDLFEEEGAAVELLE